ncbi:hypothetical protein A0O28_0005020 [Trichoderma guizhouense]|uniref:Uncharacterized protein n=1 Tax=Trichoderma guizhouense TaxID=1491466 RepID=A0A1T3CH36_9HYPO|nr:hypothetical protein A0O28_0005020 [Trichoderma guizhouense]
MAAELPPEEPPPNYRSEAHNIYLGKNRRLADPIFFPASMRSEHEMRTIEEELAREMEEEPDGPREFTKDVMILWGWGICTRWPPGGPVPRLQDYEKSMNAMTADVYKNWIEIQSLVRNHEDAIRDWILRFSLGIEKQETRDTNILYAGIQQSWKRTVKTFNNCADDIKRFMKSDSIESDFEIDVPNYPEHLLGFICREAKLPITTPKSPGEQERIFRSSRASIEVIKQRALANWFDFTKQQAFLPPPIQISPRYLQDLEFKMEVAEKHIQELFSDPGYFFGCIYTLKEHHWANIELERDETKVNERDPASIYIKKYVEEYYRHVLYFDLIRGVLRRSIFEFYMWHAIHTCLQEFQVTMRESFEDYGKEDESDTDGTEMLQRPPIFLSDKAERDHAALAEKYLSLVVLLRYDAVFFINEFRKKGIHAGDHTAFEVATVDPPKEGTQSRQNTIDKKHYRARSLYCWPNFRNQYLRVDEYSADEILRMFFFNSMDNFISDALNCTNCGITEAAGYLQAMSRAHDPDSTKHIFTDLMDDTIDNLNLLSSLADHLECLWPAMDIVGGAAVREDVRREYYDLGCKDISINFLDFDEFDFEKKMPVKRLKRLFLFFDELQGFKDETISMGHAKGDLKRFGASLLCKFIYPLNDEGADFKANQEAISRLEKAMGVSGSDYVFSVKETPINLDEKTSGKGAKVQLVGQPLSYRNVAARERERQEQRDAFNEALRANKEAMAEMCRFNPRWATSLHSALEQFQIPPALVDPLADALSGVSLQPIPNAPDGQPKGVIKKRDWATLEAVYNIHGSANAAVSYAQLKLAMVAMGYKEDPSGGSHMRFVRQNGRWPHDVLPKGENVIIARTHGGEHAAAAKGKAMDWGRRFCERGLTFEFIQQWYVKG